MYIDEIDVEYPIDARLRSTWQLYAFLHCFIPIQWGSISRSLLPSIIHRLAAAGADLVKFDDLNAQ